jgi:hypothetical protein
LGDPNPFYGKFTKGDVIKHMRKNNKQINFRVSEKDYNYIKKQSEKSKCTITNFLLYSALNKNIYVVNGLEDVTRELSKMGNNLNQLTRLCHQGSITCLDLDEVKGQVKKIWQLLNLLTPSQL